MRLKKILLSILFSWLLLASSTRPSFAQGLFGQIQNGIGMAACGAFGLIGQQPYPFCGCSSINYVNTALGCISTDAENGGFVTSLLMVLVGLGGGIALLLMLYGVFIITTSAGIPDKLNEGKEIITSAITGLLFIIVSIFLMNLIGVKILGIPGL